MTDRYDLIVVGAGPAGISAALSASRFGAATLIVDEAAQAGGQIYRALPDGFGVTGKGDLGPDYAEGERLRADLAASSARQAFGHRVWRLAPGFEVEAVGPEGLVQWTAAKLVLAGGARERVSPFPGWTRPGVMGLAAATILLKSQQMLPGRSVVVAGCGPLLAAVAAAIVKGGGKVAALVDLSSPREWLACLPAMAGRPDLLARGLRWLAVVRAARAPIFFRHKVIEAIGDENALQGVVVGEVDETGALSRRAATRTLEADCLTIGYGLSPSTEMTRLLRASHVFRPERGGWAPDCDAACRTSAPGVYACGDGAGIAGAAAATLQGQLAGLTAAFDLGRMTSAAYEKEAGAVMKRLRHAARFGSAMCRLMAPRPGMTVDLSAETIVCRCEDVTRADIEDAIGAGAFDVNQIKSWTRAGMGPCQGRMCAETISALAGVGFDDHRQSGQWTGRPPLRPVPLAAIIGEYRYEDMVWKGNKARIDDEGRPLQP